MPEEAVLDAPAEVEAPSEETMEVEQPDTGEVTDIAEAEPETEETAEEAEGTETEEDAKDDKAEVGPDGRTMRDSVKKGLKALGKIDPIVAKELKGIYWAEQEYRAAFPMPAEAVAARQWLTEIGGEDGIKEIAAEREEWNEIDKAFGEGSKDFVTSLAESSPEGFLKTAPHVINEFAARAPEQYQYYANNVAVNTLAAAGVSLENLSTAYNRYGDGTGKETPAQAIIAEIHGALSGLKSKATEFEQKRNSVDPERQKLQQDKSNFEMERRATFENGVAEKAESYLKEKMQPELDRVIAGRKIDPDAMKGYQKMVNDEVMRRLGEVPGFADKLEAHYRTGDAKKSVEYIQAQYNRILPEAAKVIAPFLRNIAPGKTQAAKTTTNGNGTVRPASPGEITLKEMPSWDQLDPNWRNTPEATAELMQGRAVLRNGKRASGWVQ